MSASGDQVVSAVTSSWGFRLFAARTTDTVRGVVRSQPGGAATARHLGDLVTAAVLLRSAMAPALRVQCVVRGAGGRGILVADSHPSGDTRGLVQLPADAGEVELGRDSLLQAMRTLHDGRIQQGVVQVPEGGTLSDAFMAYMQQSEQAVTMAAFTTLLADGAVAAAGGYLVQVLPDALRESLRAMTERIERFGSVDRAVAGPGFSARGLLADVLGDVEFEVRDEIPVRFGCWCDEVRVVAALASLSRADLESLLSDGEVIELSCEYCGKDYRIPPARLRGLLGDS